MTKSWRNVRAYDQRRGGGERWVRFQEPWEGLGSRRKASALLVMLADLSWRDGHSLSKEEC
jgi:hypothetical protein